MHLGGILRRELCLSLLALQVLACGATEESSPPPNVLVIMVDTLRADRLGAYGSGRGLTPFVDELAKSSTVFHAAYAASSWTSPSIASLLTSRYPFQHGIVGFDSVLAAREWTLPEVLSGEGYITGGFSANPLLGPSVGFGQGYDSYEQVRGTSSPTTAPGFSHSARASSVVSDALSWLETLPRDGRPIFLYVHFMEPHTPYQPDDDALERVLDGRPRPAAAKVSHAAILGRRIPVDPDMLRDIEDLYDAEIASLDAALGPFFDGLRQVGFLDHALVVFTSDHGEELLDHGAMGHAHTLYQELIRVPLLVQHPGQTERRDVEQPVGLIDLAPTIVRSAGIEIPPSFEGRPLEDVMSAADADRRPILSELVGDGEATTHERAIVIGQTKLIESAGGEREFFALDRDPREQDGNAVASAERTALVRMLESIADVAHASAEKKPLDAESLEQLKALGYID